MTSVKGPQGKAPPAIQQVPSRPVEDLGQEVQEAEAPVEGSGVEQASGPAVDRDQVENSARGVGQNVAGITAQLRSAGKLGAAPEQKVDGRLGLFQQAPPAPPPSVDEIYEAIVDGGAAQNVHAKRAQQAVNQAQETLPALSRDALAWDFSALYEACDGNSQQAASSLQQTVQARKALPHVPGADISATYVGLMEEVKAQSNGRPARANQEVQRLFQALCETAQQRPDASLMHLFSDCLTYLEGSGYDTDKAIAKLQQIWGTPQPEQP